MASEKINEGLGYVRQSPAAATQAIFCRRRHQPSRPPPARIRPGRPAPAMGPGTGPKYCSQIPGFPVTKAKVSVQVTHSWVKSCVGELCRIANGRPTEVGSPGTGMNVPEIFQSVITPLVSVTKLELFMVSGVCEDVTSLGPENKPMKVMCPPVRLNVPVTSNAGKSKSTNPII